MHHLLKYTLKVWFTSVMISPVIFLLYEIIRYGHPIVIELNFVLYLMLFGGIFSIPSAVLLWLITYLMSRTNFNNQAQKTVLTFIGFALTWLPFFAITHDVSLTAGVNDMVIIYALVIVAGIWLYRLQPVSDDPLPENTVESTELKQETEIDNLPI